jgi:hypothetical protein
MAWNIAGISRSMSRALRTEPTGSASWLRKTAVKRVTPPSA